MPRSNTEFSVIKEAIRVKIWTRLQEEGVAKFPPAFGRIPNFEGAERACQNAIKLLELQRASCVKVNPDSPQKLARRFVLSKEKTLVMPTPRISQGFLLIRGSDVPAHMLDFASTIRGAFKFGRRVSLLEIPRVECILVGSVAVSLDGARIGKGEGYSEIEYAILRELGCVDERTPIITTVHDLQIVEGIPVEEFDVPVDYIVTPTRTIKVEPKYRRPEGVLWEYIDEKALKEIPALKELKRLKPA